MLTSGTELRLEDTRGCNQSTVHSTGKQTPLFLLNWFPLHVTGGALYPFPAEQVL